MNDDNSGRDYPETRPRTQTVKDLNAEDRPREKAQLHGVQALSKSECLAIMLRSGRPGLPVTEISHNLMKRVDNNFHNLERLTDEEIMETPGLGPVKVLELRTMLEIMRRYANEKTGDRFQIKSSSDIYDLMRFEIGNLPYEQIWAIFVDNANRVIRKMKMTEGSATASIHDNKKVLKQALLSDAQGVVLCHNHPSGTLRPSIPDQSITDNMARACKAVDLKLLDHLIITAYGYYSFHDEGKL